MALGSEVNRGGSNRNRGDSKGSHRPRRKPARQSIEDGLLENPRWSGLRQQRRLQDRHHTAVETRDARRRCQQLLQYGYGGMDPDQHGGFPD